MVEITQAGLSEADALYQLNKDGHNELPQSEQRRLPRILKEIVTEPMVFLLLSCGGIYLTLGDRGEALMLLGFLGLILGITLYQERKSEKALKALHDLSSPRALVVRDGNKKRIAGRDVVRKDVILLNEGDRVPADAEILSAQNLAIDESLLTGESVPVTKMPSKVVYAGTTVVKGTAVAKVIHTGNFTELGKIGKAIQRASPEKTNLQLETRRLVWIIAIVAAVLCLLVIVVYGFTRQDWLEGFLVGLTLAMAILPNELPAVLTIFLSLGAWRLSQKRVLTRRTPTIEALGTATVLCVDKTGTLTLNKMVLRKLHSGDQSLDLNGIDQLPESFHEIVEYGILAGEKDPFDPMDRAFKEIGQKFLVKTEHLHTDWDLVKQYPLSPELLALSHAWKTIDGKAYPIAAKGAPEAVIDLCHLNPNARAKLEEQVTDMAAAGLRVIGVAKAKFPKAPLPEKQHDFDFEFLGLAGLEDPLRPEVPRAIDECHSAGIRVVMITGDHPATARSIARQIHLSNPDSIITGEELGRLSEAEIQERVRNVNVCARMVPEQKLKLISALKRNGEVVAMTGDGVNDAPALKSAHIGIAMGQRGTDVARESAALVLLDDDFGSIVEAIKMGRQIYENLKHAIAYLLAVHIPITGISILPVFLKLPLILLPIHIAFLHLIIEPACSIVFEAEPMERGLMARPPRRGRDRLFSSALLLPALLQGTVVLAGLLAVFLGALLHNGQELRVRTLTFTTLIIANLGLIFTNRSWSSLGFRKSAAPNLAFRIVFVAALAFLFAALAFPPLRKLFLFSPLHWMDFTASVGIGLACSLWFEVFKVLRK